MIEVEATDKYRKLKIVSTDLKRIPDAKERFFIEESKLKTLLGDNEYKAVFVKEINKPTEKVSKKKK